MSSTWLRDRASLDDSLALLSESLGKLHASLPIDIPEIARQLGAAADAIRNLQAFVSSELPDASWQSRDEFDTLLDKVQKTLDARAIEQLRSRLLDLAAELERGTIVHRRELRVEQVNQLREQAINELLDHAGSDGAPPPLPGPDAPHWVEWACELKEPEDTQSLQMLRSGFARLDDLVANLEPGMWMVGADAAAAQQAHAEAQRAEEEELQKALRSRLLALADELGAGSIVHHRAFRVTQLMQLRDEAVAELRAQAAASATPHTLPGPAPNEWVAWACLLKEPEDAESLQLLRDGFAHLDDFVANLEPNMWVAPGAQKPEAAHEPEKPAVVEPPEPEVRHAEPVVAVASAAAAVAVARAAEPQPQASQVHEQAVVEPPAAKRSSKKKEQRKAVAEPQPEPAPVPVPVPSVFEESSESTTNPVKEFLFKSAPDEPLGGKWRMLVAAAAVLVVVLGGFGLWRWHKNHSGINTVQATEKKPSEVTPAVPAVGDASSSQTVIDAANAAHAPGNSAQPNNQAKKDQTAAAKPGAAPAPASKQPGKPDNTTPPQQPVTVARLDNGALRTPTAMPKVSTGADDPAAPSGIPGAVPGGSAAGGPNFGSLVNVPVTEPKLAAGKVKVSSGVAQGLLIHQVTPQYPLQARESGIHGTVVVDAIIAKDGSVRSVKAIKGNPLLVQSALEAVKQWRYKPYFLNGEPIDAETQISVNFNLPSQ